jgi:hypothetical protein
MLPDNPLENTVLMIWNADSGWRNALMDSLHKFISPGTYPCSLCKITHGATGPKPDWNKFLKEWNYEVYCLHRDEFLTLPLKVDSLNFNFPAVLQFRKGKWHEILSASQLKRLTSLEELKILLQNA